MEFTAKRATYRADDVCDNPNQYWPYSDRLVIDDATCAVQPLDIRAGYDIHLSNDDRYNDQTNDHTCPRCRLL